MRLLKLHDDGSFSHQWFSEESVPPYAILSHTWSTGEDDEATFKDLKDGTGLEKPGFQKLKYCGKQAKEDDLHYFWVDTCCIDKSNTVELQHAINSMFRWYQMAAKCYVYLSDVSDASSYTSTASSEVSVESLEVSVESLEVSVASSEVQVSSLEFQVTNSDTSGPSSDVPDPCLDTDNQVYQNSSESSFRRSRWFKRGWTLQELIAPKSVEFFSKPWKNIGSKTSLERQICEITSIPVQALRGSSLDTFSITERISWAERRNTKYQEDKVYSLLGIFGVYMPLNYGEGKDYAFQRLHEEIQRVQKGRHSMDFSISFSLVATEIDQFVARERELAEIHDILHGDGSRRICVLHGLGGIGKTQLTIEYSKRYRHSYSAVFWLNINDEDSLKQSFVKIAKLILREHSSVSFGNMNLSDDLDATTDAVKSWLSLSNNSRWLLIYDNYDNPKIPGNAEPNAVDIQKYLPEAYQGSIIVTTRSSQVTIGRRINIKKLENVKDSIKILANNSRRKILVDDLDAIKLATELDGLPLALATAGAYLDQVPAASLSDYLRLYKASWLKLQVRTPELSSYEDRTLYSTWQISFEHVKKQNELSAKLLQLWAYFDNQDLWFELLQHCDSESPDWLRELTDDELSFNNAISVLCNHGLVDVNTSQEEFLESRGYSMHGCVHAWTMSVLNQDWNEELAQIAMECVASHIPGEEVPQGWLIQRRLLQHVSRCLLHMDKGLLTETGLEWTFHCFGDLYSNQSKLDEAQKMYERALRGKEKTFGSDHTSTINTVNDLGQLYAIQGNLDEAEKMFERALREYEKQLGPDHTSTLNPVHNLGLLYSNQGKLEEAEKMYQRALRGCEKALGPDHKSTLKTVNNLGSLYLKQRKLDEAEKMYERALQGLEKAVGPDHTTTLKTVHNLGILYADQGKSKEAEKMYQQAIQGYENALGPVQIRTYIPVSHTFNSLGILYAEQGKLDEAEKMYQQALQGYENALGQVQAFKYLPALKTLKNLALLYAKMGKQNKAEEMYQLAIRGYEKAFGPDHLATLDTFHDFGLLYANEGKLEEAEKMYQQALQGYEKKLGPVQVDTYVSALHAINNLGLLYTDQGKLDEADKMFNRSLQGYDKVFGPNHRFTLESVDSLLRLFRDRCFLSIKMSALRKVILKPSLSSSTTPVDDILNVVDLCMKHPLCRTKGFGRLCAMFRWIDEDSLSIAAFWFSVADALPSYIHYCDGCGHDLDISTGRLSCKSCKDIDLCGSCLEKYDLDEFRDKMVDCQDHIFLQLAKPGSMDKNIDIGEASVDKWLRELKSTLEDQRSRT